MDLTDDDRAVLAYYEAHFHDRLTERAVKAANWALLEAAGGVEGKDVVDLGCGFPHDALRGAGEARSWLLVDFCQSVLIKSTIVLASAGVTVTELEEDIRDLPIPDTSTDVVLCFATLGQVPTERERVHAEAFRVLRPSGCYCLTVPDRACFGFKEARGPDVCGYMATWTREELDVELVAAGFVVRDVHTGLHAHLSAWAEKPRMPEVVRRPALRSPERSRPITRQQQRRGRR